MCRQRVKNNRFAEEGSQMCKAERRYGLWVNRLLFQSEENLVVAGGGGGGGRS